MAGFLVQAVPEARVAAWVARVTAGAKSVLDLGCGLGEYITVCDQAHRCGMDMFQPYVDDCKRRLRGAGIVFECGNVLDYRTVFDHPHDCVLLIDVIEHLEKSDGLRLLEMLREDAERIAVFTPIGWHEQDEIDGNPAQRHISAWEADELRGMGFEVIEDPFFHHTNPPEKRAAMFAVWRKP